MKKNAFTMIELVFVIVILGILSAVALPKFMGVSQQAKIGKIKGFVGTMNRTVAPTIWSKSLAEGNNGSITSYCANLSTYVDIPLDVLSVANDCTVTLTDTTLGSVAFTDGSSSTLPFWEYTAP